MSRQSSKAVLLFSTGEITPKLAGRSDIERIPNACRTLQNMVVRRNGPVTRRAGLEFINSIKGGSLAEQTLVVQDSVASSGSFGTKHWELSVVMTLNPTAAVGSDERRIPRLTIVGHSFGTGGLLMGYQVIDEAVAVPYQWIFETTVSAESTRTVGPNPGDNTWDGLGSLRVPTFGTPNWVDQGEPRLVEGTYYRFRVFGQITGGSYGNFVTSNWFTVDGGFEADGFTPP